MFYKFGAGGRIQEQIRYPDLSAMHCLIKTAKKRKGEHLKSQSISGLLRYELMICLHFLLVCDNICTIATMLAR